MTAASESQITDVTQDMTSAGDYGHFGTLKRLQCSTDSHRLSRSHFLK